MAEPKSVYLVCGDDDTKIDTWRTRVRLRAEEEGGPGALESFDAASCEPSDVAAAMATLSFGIGTRFLLIDGVGAWKAPALRPLDAALASPAPDTVIVLIARGKPPKAIRAIVEHAGGEVREYAAPKPWELPRWATERAREEGVQLEPDVAKELVALAGASQARLVSEIEKLAVAVHPSTRVTLADVEALVAGEAAPQAYELADAVIGGDLPTTLALAEGLCAREGRPSGLAFPIVRRLREVHRAAALLNAGVPERTAAERVSRQPWLAKRIVAKARSADRAALERALCVFADLEVEQRGGADRSLDDETAFTLALARATR
ncbi:MAG: DNA polymerase III subunit delta [Nocardioidaceae bacterium]